MQPKTTTERQREHRQRIAGKTRRFDATLSLEAAAALDALAAHHGIPKREVVEALLIEAESRLSLK